MVWLGDYKVFGREDMVRVMLMETLLCLAVQWLLQFSCISFWLRSEESYLNEDCFFSNKDMLELPQDMSLDINTCPNFYI